MLPPPAFTSSAAVLLVRDVVTAANHYRDQLGFSFDGFFNDPPDFCILRRDGCHLMLKQAADPVHVVPHWKVSPSLCNVYFWVTDAEALYHELKARGAKIDYDLCTQPYGCREFGVQDLDGYDLAFGQIIRRTSKV